MNAERRRGGEGHAGEARACRVQRERHVVLDVRCPEQEQRNHDDARSAVRGLVQAVLEQRLGELDIRGGDLEIGPACPVGGRHATRAPRRRADCDCRGRAKGGGETSIRRPGRDPHPEAAQWSPWLTSREASGRSPGSWVQELALWRRALLPGPPQRGPVAFGLGFPHTVAGPRRRFTGFPIVPSRAPEAVGLSVQLASPLVGRSAGCQYCKAFAAPDWRARAESDASSGDAPRCRVVGLALRSLGCMKPGSSDTLSKGVVVVLEAIDSTLSRLALTPDGPETRNLREMALACAREAEGWREQPPSSEQRETLMERVLAVHVAVDRLAARCSPE